MSWVEGEFRRVLTADVSRPYTVRVVRSPYRHELPGTVGLSLVDERRRSAVHGVLTPADAREVAGWLLAAADLAESGSVVS